MDTPITVSSTSTGLNKSDFIQLNYSPAKHEESVISLDSTSYERVPVSWESRSNKFTRTDSNTTLNNIQKVSNWIRSIEGEELRRNSVGPDLHKNKTFLESNKATIMEPPNKDEESDAKSVILFRCDFNKSVTAKTYFPPLNPFNRATPLINYFKNEKSSKIPNSTSKVSSNISEVAKSNSLKSVNKKGMLKHLILKRPNSSKLINYSSESNNKFSIDNESYCSKANDEKSEGDSDVYDVPMSPESRKKELCSYLQLMNPADKKERFILQNRRSTRVRNLAAMQEKKELERKIKQSDTEVIDHIEKDSEKCATLKSFKELNIKVDKNGHEYDEEHISDIEFDNDSFCFPFPSKHITETVNDFDIIMKKLVPRFKRICKLKNIKLNAKIKLRKSNPEIKKKLVRNLVRPKHKDVNVKNKKNNSVRSIVSTKEHKLKETLKTRYKNPTDRSNSLRSTGKLKNITLKKLINKRETGKGLKNKKSLRKKVLRKRQINETKQGRTRQNLSPASSSRNSKAKSTASECEIITVMGKTEDRIDLENFMDDMIDFNILSEEHKKCLIESRILSTKPITQTSTANCPKAEFSKSFYSFDAVSPLYGFNKPDVNEVKKICEVYKNSSLLKNCKPEIMQDFFDRREIKIEENEAVESIDYKTENEKSSVEKLASIMIDDIGDEFADDLGDNKFEIESNQEETVEQVTVDVGELTNGISLQEHDYAGLPNEDEDGEDKEIDVVTVPKKNLPVTGYMQINPRRIEKRSKYELLPYNKSIEMKSLHRSLQYLKRKSHSGLTDHSFAREWVPDTSPKQKSKNQSHSICIDKENGSVLKAFYIDYNLIVCQEYIVSFWMQTPLGNVLGSQNMWIPRGQTQRLVLNNKCIQKESMEMVIAMETHVAYIELWTKEHKSDIREGPVADVFATVYFWKQRQNGLEKKVLQLENINGFADDVQYSVMKCAPKIIVSWHSANEDSIMKRTFIHAYQLAADYQTVANIYDIEPVDHYVSSLHNIEDCDNLIMGCGENKITLWNVEYGYIVATVELSEIKSPLSTLWVKCDRGFLFALQQCVDRELRLIAINGINHSWKKLASYIPPEGFDRLRGVCIENGLLLSFYDQGILCWKAETGEPVEETNIESEIIPSGKYVILLEDNHIIVKHAITHLMSVSIDDT